MKNVGKFFCAVIGAFVPMLVASGDTLEIGPNETYAIPINVDGILTVENAGTITSPINVSDGSSLYIENTGTFNGTVTLGNLSTITQIIKNDNDITRLTGIDSDYNVLIDSSETLNWNKIIDRTPGAEKYTFNNANLHMDTLITVDNVNVSNRVIVYTDVVPDSDFVLFTNFFGDGTVNIVSNNLGSLYLLETYIGGSDMRVRVIRSTDYARVLNNDTGVFLNSLRQVSPDDALLGKLDAMTTLDDFNRIIERSVKIYPIKMMQSLRMLYAHKSLEIMHIAHDDGMGIMPNIILSNNLSTMGAEPYLNLNVSDDLHMKISGSISSLKYSDDINSYDAMSYGIGADAIYSLPFDNFVRVYGGANFSSFDAGLVFDGNGTVENPNGWSGYLVGEFGHNFNFYNKYYVSPFVMIGGDYATILNSDETNYYIGAGADAGFNFEFDGFRYDYALRAIGRTDGGVGAELNASIWSLADSAGAGLRGGVFYNNIFGVSYRIGLDVRFNF